MTDRAPPLVVSCESTSDGEALDAMPRIHPEYSRTRINAAGKRMADPSCTFEEWIRAHRLVDNWRAAHGYPLNSIYRLLSRHAYASDPQANVAQRLKRIRSIESKMRRRVGKLTQMQDVGGCRAVVRSIGCVKEVVRRMKNGRAQHELIDEDDYIGIPQETGYRSHHLVYAHKSRAHPIFDNMRIEVQVRTEAQHAWATAVEVVGFFLGEDLKAGVGDPDWLRFFQLTSHGIALREGTPLVESASLDQRQLRDALIDMEQRMGAVRWLSGFRSGARMASKRSHGYWHILEFDSANRAINRYDFPIGQFDDANATYIGKERDYRNEPHMHVVMVSASDLRAIRKAYPAFFGDFEKFTKILASFIGP